MARVIDVEVESERIRINFPFDREILNLVRTLPERQFDPRSKSWFVPIRHLDFVLHRLNGHHFKHSPRLKSWQKDKGNGHRGEPLVAVIPDDTLTVSGLNLAARATLEERFRRPLWVVGELQDFDKNRSNAYPTYFFDLLERPLPGAAEVARVKAVLFERERLSLEQKLQTEGIELRDGVQIRALIQVDLYVRQGSFQVQIKDVDPSFTAGELELNRERVFRHLQTKGIAEQNQKIPWPRCPLRIGVITSHESDAYNDFIHQLQKSGIGFTLTAHHANVQGANTEASVLTALKYFRERKEHFDIIAIIRGGGSRSDLAYFDTPAIGVAVCTHPVKVICGIGHQRDTSLLDLISHSTKTPTAAAATLVERVESFRGQLEDTYQRIGRAAHVRTQEAQADLYRCGTYLERAIQGRLIQARRHQVRMGRLLLQGTQARIRREGGNLEGMEQRMKSLVGRRLERERSFIAQGKRLLSGRSLPREMALERERLTNILHRLKRASTQRLVSESRQLKALGDGLHYLDPRRVLERGFALVRSQNRIIGSSVDLEVGEVFEIQFSDGSISARREEKENNQAPDMALEEHVDE